MNYKALYRSYRPRTFEKVIGQKHIVSTLMNIIEADKVSHAYLFSGPRGTGKTSLAKIFAKAINKTATNNIMEEEREFLDIIEIDAASNNGVNEIRDIRDKIKFTPIELNYKVYIIDEVHMLTIGAFNALLKTLEEPPAHIVFILATTEPNKIPITILSRVQRYNFTTIRPEEIIKHLEFIYTKEFFEFEEEALLLVSRLAEGSLRDALSISDQVSAYSRGKITTKAIMDVFGIENKSTLIKLINDLSAKKLSNVIKAIDKFSTSGSNLKIVLSSIIDILKDYIIYYQTNSKSLLTFLAEIELEKIQIPINKAYIFLDKFIEIHSKLSSIELPYQMFNLSVIQLSETIQDGGYPVNVPQTRNIEPTKQPKPLNQNQSMEVMSNPIPTENKETLNVDLDSLFEDTQEIEVNQDVEYGETTEEIELPHENEHSENIVIKKEVHEIKEIDPTQEIISDTQEIKEANELKIDELLPSKQIQDKVQKIIFSEDEIINLFLLSSNSIKDETKNNWNKIHDYKGHIKYGIYAMTLEKCGFISAGDEFILAGTMNSDSSNEINSNRQEKPFLEFTKELFGKPKLVYIITNQQFKSIKDKYIQLKNSNELPAPKKIDGVKLEEIEVSKVEEYGQNLFGDIFKS